MFFEGGAPYPIQGNEYIPVDYASTDRLDVLLNSKSTTRPALIIKRLASQLDTVVHRDATDVCDYNTLAQAVLESRKLLVNTPFEIYSAKKEGYIFSKRELPGTKKIIERGLIDTDKLWPLIDFSPLVSAINTMVVSKNRPLLLAPPINLSEAKLLAIFMLNFQNILPRDVLMDSIKEDGNISAYPEQYLGVYINSLRQQLSHTNFRIENIHSRGYLLDNKSQYE